MTEDIGRKGEALAAKYYMRRGYLLLNHNYRTAPPPRWTPESRTA